MWLYQGNEETGKSCVFKCILFPDILHACLCDNEGVEDKKPHQQKIRQKSFWKIGALWSEIYVFEI